MSAAGGRVVVVTGGTRGIGLGLARELLARDCRVVVCGRSAAERRRRGRRAGRGCARIGSPASPADVTVAGLRAGAVGPRGRDVRPGRHLDQQRRASPRRAGRCRRSPRTTVAAVVATNLVGATNGCAVALAGLQQQPAGGWIWNMEGFGSNGQMQPGMAAYGATKRAVTYLTESLVKETKDGNVKVGFLSPGHRRHRPADRRLRRPARGVREGPQDLQHPR